MILLPLLSTAMRSCRLHKHGLHLSQELELNWDCYLVGCINCSSPDWAMKKHQGLVYHWTVVIATLCHVTDSVWHVVSPWKTIRLSKSYGGMWSTCLCFKLPEKTCFPISDPSHYRNWNAKLPLLLILADSSKTPSKFNSLRANGTTTVSALI